MPPQKRACFTTPSPRFEVGESSVVGAARQPGPTLEVDLRRDKVREIGYGITYTWDEIVEAMLEIAPTTLEGVNQRVTELATTVRQDTDEFYTSSLQTQLTTALGRIKILEARDPEPQDEPAEAGSSCVAAALTEHDADRSRNGNDNHDSGTGERRHVSTVHECTFTDFLKCQPMNFKGTEGVVGLTKWLEKIESVFHISNCTVACQVKFVTCTLQGNALTWWNSHVRAVRHDIAYAMFVIDGRWRYSPDVLWTKDEAGNTFNILDLQEKVVNRNYLGPWSKRLKHKEYVSYEKKQFGGVSYSYDLKRCKRHATECLENDEPGHSFSTDKVGRKGKPMYMYNMRRLAEYFVVAAHGLAILPQPLAYSESTVIRSMFEISGNNFNDWFSSNLMVILRVERKLFVIEQPISLASPIDFEYLRSGMRYMIHNEELKSMFEKQVGVEWFDPIQTFHACKQDEGKPVAYLRMDTATTYKEVGYCKMKLSCLPYDRKSLPHRPGRATDLLGIIHTDVCDPLRHVSRQVENQLGKTIKALRSDRGGEYISQEFKDYLKANGIVQQLTPPYTPQHNGVSERRNRTLLDMVRSMMNLTTLPLSFWDYALESATRILNMVPTKKVDKTPYELWYGKVPNLSYLKVWGCEALVKRDTPDKLEQRSVKCIFIGYPKETMGYYFYFPPENKIVVARYAEFFEKRLISQEISGRAVDLEEIQEEEDTTPSEITSNIPQEVEGFEPPQEEVIPIRRSERPHRAPNRLCLNVEVEEHSLGDLNEPASYKAAMLDSESNKWIDAMNAEIQSMMDNMVWVLVDLPPGCKTVGSRWLFKKKTDMDGIVHVYKARLVAKGYTQLYGVDYEETFSPVADIRAIRILISIAAYYDYEIWQMDVKTAFLNGYLDEDIYMVQPEGFVDPNHPRKVCKLQRSIYGLKQASRSWNKRFDEEIKRFGFAQNLDEPCVYQKASGSNDLREAAFILGIKIYRDRSKRLIGLGQNAYMDKILKRYRMDNSKRGHIPMQERLDLNKTQGASTPEEVKRMQNVPYASDVDAVDWKSSKQSTTAMSATEAEYIAASEAAMEAVWIRKFISGLGIIPTINEPIGMFCDNSAALHFANEPGVQKGTRHYHRRYHYVHECIALGEIRFLKVHTYYNLVDPFTKALPKGKLTQHARSMGLHLASSFM
ncbi:retrotransposon protein, putative, ty1-copia subclass [Tanacetum coccineum]